MAECGAMAPEKEDLSLQFMAGNFNHLFGGSHLHANIPRTPKCLFYNEVYSCY